MKIIKYKLLMGEVTTASGEIQRNLVDTEILCPTEKDYENNLPIVQKTAYNGEYTIEDDGQPEPEAQPSDAERISELEEALALLLSGVTE